MRESWGTSVLDNFCCEVWCTSFISVKWNQKLPLFKCRLWSSSPTRRETQYLNPGTLSAFSEPQKDLGKRKAEMGVLFPFVSRDRSFLGRKQSCKKSSGQNYMDDTDGGSTQEEENVVLLSLDSQSMFDINLCLHLLINTIASNETRTW